MTRCVAIVCLALLVIYCIGPVAPAHAAEEWRVRVEPDWRGYYRSSTPVAHRDFRRYLDTLELSDEQVDMANGLFAAFDNEIRDLSTHMREQRSDMQHIFEKDEKKQRKQQQARMRLTDQYDKRAKELATRLFSDLRLILSPEQEQAWKDLEQLRRRRETLARFSAFPEENLDLIVLLDGLKMPDELRQSLDGTLKSYLAEFDIAVTRRNAKVASLSDKAKEIVALQRQSWMLNDEQAYEELWARISKRQDKLVPDAKQLRDLCKRVRSINEKYVQQITLALSSDVLVRFEQQVARVIDKADDDGWGDYNRARYAMRAIEQLRFEKPIAELRMQAYGEDHPYYQNRADRLRGIPALTDAQLTALENLRQEFESEYHLLRKRHGKKPKRSRDQTQFDFQLDGADLTLYQGERPKRSWERWEEEQPDEDFQKANSKLSQRYIDRLRDLLTIEQRSYIANY